MAEKEQQFDGSSGVPPDSDLFTTKVRKNLSERDLFVGDEDFYRLLADSRPLAPPKKAAAKRRFAARPAAPSRFSVLQKIFVAGIIVIEAMLLYIVLKPLLWPAKRPPAPLVRQPAVPLRTAPQSQPVDDEQNREPAPLFASTEPVSLRIAHNLYMQKDYSRAYAAYDQLYQSLPPGTEEELLKNFLQLKMALCLNKQSEKEHAKNLFTTLAQSRSPVIRLISNHELSFLHVQENHYLKARTRAYKTLAMIGAVDFSKDWIFSLTCDCNFLIAEALTRNILSLCDAETSIQSILWSSPVEIDPFANLDKGQLREMLGYGSEHLREGLLIPHIRKLEHHDVVPRYSISAYGASVQELLARFVSNAGLDINWTLNNAPVAESPANAVRKRPVSIYLSSATAQQAVEIIAGHVGLLSHFDEKGLVRIANPADYASLSEHISLLIRYTIAFWRNFLLTFPEDRRIPSVHFALGLLQAQNAQPAGAIAEYKLVANQFSLSPLAPYALMRSSKLKAELRDYRGARDDLTQLVEQYPDTEFYGLACLNLADATKNAGFFAEAHRLYRKVYYLGLSAEMQIASAIGAGKCSFQIQDYNNAEKWLTEYLNIPNNPRNENFYMAYFLLGKTYTALGNPRRAAIAFQYALSGPVQTLSREKYVETVSALVDTYVKMENFVEALTLIETVDSWRFSKKESYEILLMKSRVLRLMGLPDKAAMILENNIEYLSQSELKTRMSFELAKCLIDKGNPDDARRKLSAVLVDAAPGPLANEILLELAQLCLDTGQSSQTVTFCLQLLDSRVSQETKLRTQKLLASAYNQQKKFQNAALALLNGDNEDEQ
jgi:tetratricopeptide (TPR) repeat protein